MRDSPLVLGYELAVLKRVPASHTGPERLVLTGHPLFSPGETRGCQVSVRVTVRADGRRGHRVRRRHPRAAPRPSAAGPAAAAAAGPGGRRSTGQLRADRGADPARAGPVPGAARCPARRLGQVLGRARAPGARPADRAGAGAPGLPGRGMRQRRPAAAAHRPARGAHQRGAGRRPAAARLGGRLRRARGRLEGRRPAARGPGLGGAGRSRRSTRCAGWSAARWTSGSTSARRSSSAPSGWCASGCRSGRAAGDRDRGRAAGASARARHEQADHSVPRLGGRDVGARLAAPPAGDHVRRAPRPEVPGRDLGAGLASTPWPRSTTRWTWRASRRASACAWPRRPCPSR